MSNDGGINAALLNMCAKAQASGPPALSSSSAVGLSDSTPGMHRPKEDYQWLQQAMASVESTEKKIIRLLAVVEDDKQRDLDAYMAAVEELGDLVEDINWATEFSLINGPARILKVLSGGHRIVDDEAEAGNGVLMIVAHASQLQETVQAKFAEAHWELVLIPLLRQAIFSPSGTSSSTSTSVAMSSRRARYSLATVLHAISCLCRSSEVNTIVFIKNGGLELITSILRCGVSDSDDNSEIHPEKVVRRTIFLVGSLGEFGVSTEELMHLVCKHISMSSSAESLQVAGAQALLNLSDKSLAKVKEVAIEEMRPVLKKWNNDKALIDDPRRQLANKLLH